MDEYYYEKIAYQAYTDSLGHKNEPPFEKLPEAIKDAWLAVRNAIMDDIVGN